MESTKRKVLVVGGGFGGIKAALELAGHHHYSVTLVSDHPDFRYYPTLYRTATGSNHNASSIPLSEIFKNRNIKLVIDWVEKLDYDNKKVFNSDGKAYSYDILIVALGVVTNFFGIKGLEEYAYGIKTNEEARRLRNHLHQQLADENKPDLNYVVIGGGPTGVELAGALPKYLRHIMKKHGVTERTVHIDLVEAAPRLVSRMPKAYSKAVAKHLRKEGVKLHLGQTVEAETADQLMVSGHSIASHTVIWTAGVTNHPFLKANGFNLSEHGKVLVDQYLSADLDVYVIGDNADTPYSGMAQTALYDGRFVANNLKRLARGDSPKSYKAKKPVYITPAGPHWAAVLWNKVHLYGWLGWMMRGAADFAGYHDYEPWWQAGKHWVAESEREEECQICS